MWGHAPPFREVQEDTEEKMSGHDKEMKSNTRLMRTTWDSEVMYPRVKKKGWIGEWNDFWNNGLTGS